MAVSFGATVDSTWSNIGGAVSGGAASGSTVLQDQKHVTLIKVLKIKFYLITVEIKTNFRLVVARKGFRMPVLRTTSCLEMVAGAAVVLFRLWGPPPEHRLAQLQPCRLLLVLVGGPVS